MKFLAVASVMLALVGCSGDLGRGKHVQGGYLVVEVGACSNVDGLDPDCAVKVKRSLGAGGGFLFGNSGPVVKGETLYRECWVEDGAPRCFAKFKRHPRSSYLSGGIKLSSY